MFKNQRHLIVILSLFFFSAHAKQSDSIKDYSLKIKEAAETFTQLAKKAKGDSSIIIRERNFEAISKEFSLSVKDEALLAQAIADGKTNIVSALYASMAAKQLILQNRKEFNGLDQKILSFAKVSALSEKGNATDVNLKMTPKEMSEAGLALKKKAEYSIEMLSWDKKEIDSHVAVMKKTAEIYEALKITPEEALVLAIMEVKGVDKEAALKIVRKLRDCV